MTQYTPAASYRPPHVRVTEHKTPEEIEAAVSRALTWLQPLAEQEEQQLLEMIESTSRAIRDLERSIFGKPKEFTAARRARITTLRRQRTELKDEIHGVRKMLGRDADEKCLPIGVGRTKSGGFAAHVGRRHMGVSVKKSGPTRETWQEAARDVPVIAAEAKKEAIRRWKANQRRA